MANRFYIDCEFDGHGGPLLSMAVVSEEGLGLHIRTTEEAQDPWVRENVVPLLDSHKADAFGTVAQAAVGDVIREFLGSCDAPVIIADSPVDIGRFCAALSTAPDGGWASTDYPLMRFEVHNVDCYPTDLPGAVQHNAWWDAMALRHVLRDSRLTPDRGKCTVPPEGWWCSREAGHEGPCAARPVADTYRGWDIRQGRWPEPEWMATGPNYDASWEGEEDGWVDNGQRADAPTREALIEEIDDWFELNEPCDSGSRAERQDAQRLGPQDGRAAFEEGIAQPSKVEP